LCGGRHLEEELQSSRRKPPTNVAVVTRQQAKIEQSEDRLDSVADSANSMDKLSFDADFGDHIVSKSKERRTQ